MLDRISYLYIACILIRLSIIYFTYLSILFNKQYQLFAALYAALGTGSFYHWITKSRKKGAFQQTIWWEYLRPVHGILFMLAAYLIYQKNELYLPILLLDTSIGIMGHINQHYI